VGGGGIIKGNDLPNGTSEKGGASFFFNLKGNVAGNDTDMHIAKTNLERGGFKLSRSF